jgi:hypothetical protein
MTIKLYGQAEFAKEIGWDDRKIRVYYQRGKLPEPYAKAGKRPLWTKEQIEQYKSKTP